MRHRAQSYIHSRSSYVFFYAFVFATSDGH